MKYKKRILSMLLAVVLTMSSAVIGSAEDLEKNTETQTAEIVDDGAYGPEQFRFTYSGGSGRIAITCEKVEVISGEAYATVTFSRSRRQGGSAQYDALRINGQVYYGSNTFTIPVRLNMNNEIAGRTLAMSAPHWIDYTIFVEISDPGTEKGKGVEENKNTMDEEVPEILGLTGKGTLETPQSDFLQIFTYEDDFYLIEIDAAKNTLRENKEVTEQSVYASPIIKYLVVPEGREAPAGVEKDVVVIQQPAKNVYVSSVDALRILCELNCETAVKLIGIEERELEETVFESVLERQKLGEDEENAILWGGSYDDWELRTMIKQGTRLMIENSMILPRQEETCDADMEKYIRLSERCAQINAAMLIDRSADEKDAMAKAEWYKVYGILFDCMDQALEKYDHIVNSEIKKEE